MFAYIKFEDGHKTIVKTSDIKHFKVECINRSKKYKVRWEDTFYDALIIDVGGEYTHTHNACIFLYYVYILKIKCDKDKCVVCVLSYYLISMLLIP